MTTRERPGRRLLALAAALAVGLLGVAAPARADSANIDPARRASLTLHKCVQPDTPGEAADGKEQPGANCTPIDGVEFTLYKVDDIDLTTPQGWETAKNLTAPESGTMVGGHTSSQISAVTTTSGGIAGWQGLDLGLYLVAETSTGAPDTKVVLGSQPFLVTLPYYTTDNTWNYDVHVYPKNSVAGIEKTVDDTVAQAGYGGNDVRWTVTTDIPRSGQGTQIDSYVITDSLPAGLTLDNTQLRLALDTGEGLTEGSDYTCSGALACSFLGDGITKLRANGGRKVVMTLITDVSDVGQAAQGVFTNTATVEINGTASVEQTASTTWGQLTVYKYDGANDGFLAGAKFKLCPSEDCPAQAVALDEMTTGTDGKILFPVVRPGTYYLVETEAPAGYIAAAPQQVTVTAGLTEVPAAVTSTGKNYIPVANTKQTVPQLPLTGGTGQVALAAGGIGLLAIGAVVMLLGRAAARRKQV